MAGLSRRPRLWAAITVVIIAVIGLTGCGKNKPSAENQILVERNALRARVTALTKEKANLQAEIVKLQAKVEEKGKELSAATTRADKAESEAKKLTKQLAAKKGVARTQVAAGVPRHGKKVPAVPAVRRVKTLRQAGTYAVADGGISPTSYVDEGQKVISDQDDGVVHVHRRDGQVAEDADTDEDADQDEGSYSSTSSRGQLVAHSRFDPVNSENTQSVKKLPDGRYMTRIYISGVVGQPKKEIDEDNVTFYVGVVDADNRDNWLMYVPVHPIGGRVYESAVPYSLPPGMRIRYNAAAFRGAGRTGIKRGGYTDPYAWLYIGSSAPYYRGGRDDGNIQARTSR